MKDNFINELKDMNISARSNQIKLNSLNDNLFVPFNSVISDIKEPHYWDKYYLASKIDCLSQHFSKELIEHIIQVKEKIEKDNLDKNLDNIDKTISSKKEKKMSNNQKPDLDKFSPQDNNLNKALQEGDINRIRNALMSLLGNLHLSLEEVSKSIWYVYEKNPNVFVAYEINAFSPEINTESDKWDSNYFYRQQGYLNMNFALERLLHLFNVREFLSTKDGNFKQKDTRKTERSSDSKINSNDRYSRSNENVRAHTENYTKQTNSFIKIAATVGGVIFAVIGAIFLFK
ncbi:hypothetical protein [Actinobacillus delphinicola]|uniref:Uncharacterized protein n=1 Tax=Actinobacillus delphinicola TaxID=51161 RepID=A0A448TRN7_9PAST|nr:hypothetical protein [Actinobacillus delphinicola]VEJ08717.1 Uncharacterised protein [Actinobacillus delphinicola]